MSMPQDAEWIERGLKDARLRRIINRRYVPDAPHWVRAVQMVSVGAIALLLAYSVMSLPNKSALTGLEILAGVIVFNILLAVETNLLMTNSHVTIGSNGVVHRTPMMVKVIAWEDIASVSPYAVTRGTVSYSGLGLIVYSKHGRRIVISDYYDAPQIQADIEQVLEVLRADTGRDADAGARSPSAGKGVGI